MNLSNVFDAQKELDYLIDKKQKVNKEMNNKKKILALLVEVCELANEIEFFKYWKTNKRNNKVRVLDEYADVMHFLVSFGLQKEIQSTFLKIQVYDNLEIQFLKLIQKIVKFEIDNSENTLIEIFGIFLGISNLIDISYEEIIKGYFSKSKINFKRLEDNY